MTDDVIERAAQILAGGEKRFWDYPNNDADREKFRGQARSLADEGLLPDPSCAIRFGWISAEGYCKTHGRPQEGDKP